MELTEAQKEAVKQWVKEGSSLSEIQKRLAREFQITATFMEVRLLVLDLGLQIKESSQPAARPATVAQPAGGREPRADIGTGVRVELDRVVRAGALVSGTVTFSDGVKASWALDQMGRLAMDAGGRKNYRPSEEDLLAFQEALEQELRRHGY